jgi:tetratricopeptide (TPR) repeat protein
MSSFNHFSAARKLFLLYRAEQQYFLGNFEGAIYSYDQALKMKPDFHEAGSNRGMIRVFLKTEQAKLSIM